MLGAELPATGRAASGGPHRSVPGMPGLDEQPIRSPTKAAASKASARGVRSGAEAVAACLYSLGFGEAPCIGIVGDRGTGKSTAMRAICSGYLQKSVGLVLACDKGNASRFAGQLRVDVADLAARPMDAEPRVVIFTGDPYSGIDPNPEGVAEFAWKLAARRVPTLQAVDELKWAARGGWWRRGVVWLPQSCSEGRKHGVGIVWASQSPQDAPREAVEEAGLLVCYRLAGLGLDRLEERNYLRGLPREIVEGLPGDLSPPAERGRCVILRRGQAWDRCFYRFDAI